RSPLGEREAARRRVRKGALGGAQRRRRPARRAAPEGARRPADPAIDVGCHLEAVVPIGLVVPDPAGDLAPDGSPRRGLPAAPDRPREAARIAVREVEAHEDPETASAELDEPAEYLGRGPGAGGGVAGLVDAELAPATMGARDPDAVPAKPGTRAGAP